MKLAEDLATRGGYPDDGERFRFELVHPRTHSNSWAEFEGWFLRNVWRSPAAARVIRLFWHRPPDATTVISYAELANKVGCSRRWAIVVVARLESLGYLGVARSEIRVVDGAPRQATNRYTVLEPLNWAVGRFVKFRVTPKLVRPGGQREATQGRDEADRPLGRAPPGFDITSGPDEPLTVDLRQT